jgi:2-dehydro-3-deoxy-D-arabinonate dehydratase
VIELNAHRNTIRKNTLILYRTLDGIFVEHDTKFYRVEVASLDLLVACDDLHGLLSSIVGNGTPTEQIDLNNLQAPIGNQEVWASGVTYYRSRSARIEESRSAGGGDFYDRVYSAERPELFFKAVAHKVAGPNAKVRIRRDAKWSVPEPELTLLVNPRAQIIGYTIGNDMSSRDIEGQNPLYLPQAKVYDQSCSLGPGLLIQKEALPSSSRILLDILRRGKVEFSASVDLAELKRSPETLVEYLFRDHSFPYGCFLLTGTGIVPPDSFTLESGDEIRISIDAIGTLVNTVA